MKHAHRLVILLLTALPSLPAAAALQAWLGQDRVEPGEPVELTLQTDGRGNSQPDLTPLKQDFAILGRASGSSIQITNGRMTTQAQLRLTLAPKRDGRIPIPPLNWDGEWSPALVVTVAASVPRAASADGEAAAPGSPVFLTSTLEQKQPYVQAATPLTLRVHADQPLYQASLDLPSSNDVVVQQIGKDRQSSEVRGGRSYQVIERDYLLFPQRSGHISLPGPVLEAQVADTRAAATTGDPFFDRAFGNIFGRNPFAGMMNMTRPLRLQGDAIVLDARPRPPGVAGQDWLPAQQLSLEESWRPDSGSVRAGEPFTRQLRLSAVGLSAAQLPDLAARMPLPDGIKAYPDQPSLSNDVEGDRIHGRREQDIALIASRPGRYQLPAMHVAWWDTTQNAPREVVLPARLLEILPAAGGSGGQPPVGAAPIAPARMAAPLPSAAGPLLAAQSAMASAWPWVSLVLGLLWLATLTAWWRVRRPASAAPASAGISASVADPIGAGAAHKAFRQACNENDAAAARRHLLDWARAVWPHDAPAGLNALARRLQDPALPALLRELDRACYAGGDWRGKALAETLAAMPAAGDKATRTTTELAGLYP
jgi:hypothetical protein